MLTPRRGPVGVAGERTTPKGVFWFPYCISEGVVERYFFRPLAQNKHGVVCRVFQDDKIPFLRPKHTFKEFDMVRNGNQESRMMKKRVIMA